ncbi:MAG: hypothetical protein EPN82_04910 [Bacteroidetes bacterium]|nr:MAG: hypothetical protein EPN82_04910 [Bacteroidota bacterium]
MNDRPKAFFSCSLLTEDFAFNAIIESIIVRYGFEIRGGIGRYHFSPEPISIQMKKEMDISECLIVAGAGRYFQENIHTHQLSFSMSETIVAEIGMAIQKTIPIVAFLAPNVSPGNLLPAITQYINPKYNNKIGKYYYDNDQIDKTIYNCFNIINEKRKVANKKNLKDGLLKLGAVFGVIGVGSIILSLFEEDEPPKMKNTKKK